MAVMAQQPQIAVVVAPALLKRDAMVYLMIGTDATATLALEAITTQDPLARTHPLSASDPLSCAGLCFKCLDPVLAQCWQCCVESLEFHRVEMQKPRSAGLSGFSVRAEAGQWAGNCTGSNCGFVIAHNSICFQQFLMCPQPS